MFRIIHEDFFGLEKIKLIHPETGAYVSIIPAYGGNLNELVFSKDNALHAVIAGTKSLEELQGLTINFYRGAKLSPFPNRICGGKYDFNGTTYTLECNDGLHALHGLIWNKPCVIKSKKISESCAELVLTMHNNFLHNGFPYRYRLDLEYVLDSKGFTCKTTITNTSETAMPIGDGWHPYFTTGSTINMLKLKLPVNKQLELASGIPTNNYLLDDLFTDAFKIGDTVFDHCFEIHTDEATIETLLIDENNNLTLSVWQQTGNNGYNYVQVYTPPDRKSIAIEPMTCAPDAFNNKKGLIVLAPDEQLTVSFGVKLK